MFGLPFSFVSEGKGFPLFPVLISVSTSISVFELYLQWRNYQAKKVQTKIPLGFGSKMTQEEFEKGKRYVLDSARFGLLRAGFFNMLSFGLEIRKVEGLLFGKSATWLASALSRISPFLPSFLTIPPVTAVGLMGGYSHAIFHSCVMDLLQSLLHLPFSYYSNFVVEERHGFNKMTKTLFVKDFAKSMLLRFLLLYPIIYGLILAMVQLFGERFPLYLSLGYLGVIFIFISSYSTLILPLFYKLTPLDKESPLFRMIHAHASACGFVTDKLAIMDGSRRSTHSNAMLLGFGKGKRILLYDTLVETLTPEEVVAVVRHELGHWCHSHTLKMLAMGVVQMMGLIYLSREVMHYPSLAREFGFPEAAIRPPGSTKGNTDNRFWFSPFIAFHICRLFAEPFCFALKIPQSMCSRYFEFQADRYSVMGAGPMPEVEKGETQARSRVEIISSALIKITKKENPMESDWLYALMEESHPSLTERIEALKAIESQASKKIE